MARKLNHKFSVGNTVTTPGARIRSPHYKNQFAYNGSGKIEKRGWSEPVTQKSHKVYHDDGIGYGWAYEEVCLPMYFVNGKWHFEGKKHYGVIKSN